MEKQLFNGYILAKGKRPISSITGGNYLVEPPIDHDYVGVLKDEFCQFDIDNKEYAEIVLKIIKDKKIKCNVLETSRGLHFYFKDNNKRVHGKLVNYYSAIGIPADYAVGRKNCVVPLRLTVDEPTYQTVNGELVAIPNKKTIVRKWLMLYSELDEIPTWLLPISKNDPRLLGTETRNNALFKYKLELYRNKFTNDDIVNTGRIINDYIFNTPLSDRELMTILREEHIDETFFFNEKGAFLHDVFGNSIITTNNIVLLEDTPHIFNRDGLYSPLQKDFEQVMIDKLPTIRATQRAEVFKYICLQKLQEEKFANPKYIGLKDYVLDLEYMELLPYSQNLIIRNRIPYNYDENAYHELLDKTIDKVMCHNKDLRLLFEEMLGYCLYPDMKFHKCFMLTGSSNNGKSTILNLIKELIGNKNCSSLSLQDLEKRFKPAELVGKLVNLGDDIPDTYIQDTSTFKSVVTGGAITVERKGEHPFSFVNKAKLIFCMNNAPKAADKSGGLLRRLIFIPFNAKFSSSDIDFDPFIEDKLIQQESIEYLLKLAIQGLQRLLRNNKFTDADISQQEFGEYVKKNNNVLEWLDDLEDVNKTFNIVKKTTVYNEYTFWCNDNGVTPFAYKQFLSTVLEKVDGLIETIKSVEGKSTRVFVIEKRC